MASFDAYIDETVARGDLAGVALWAQTADGRMCYDRALGVASLKNPDPAQRPPMTTDTVVRLASSSKLITTIAVLQAVDQGLVGLDDDVAEHVPELAALEVLEGFTWYGKPLTRPRDPAAPITLRSLLTHTAGTGYDFLKWQPLWRVRWWRGETIAGGTTLEERLAHPLLHDPGAGWTYGSGVSWAGRVLERVSGGTLEQWMARHIAAPLGLTTLTCFPQWYPRTASRLAGMASRSGWSGQLAHQADLPQPNVSMGGEGIHCSVADLGKILFSLLVDDGRLLEPATAAQMFAKQLTPAQRAPLDECLALPVWICRSVLERGQYDWGLGGVLIDGTSKTGLQDGALMWSGLYHILWVAPLFIGFLLNFFFVNCDISLTNQWIDRKAGVCGVFATQLVPAVDKVGVPAIVAFQREIYRRLGFVKDGDAAAAAADKTPASSPTKKQHTENEKAAITFHRNDAASSPASPTRALAAWASSFFTRDQEPATAANGWRQRDGQQALPALSTHRLAVFEDARCSVACMPPTRDLSRVGIRGRATALVVAVFYMGRRSASKEAKAQLTEKPLGEQAAKDNNNNDDEGEPLFTSTQSTLPLDRVVEAEHDTSPENLAAARVEIAAIVGDDAVHDSNDERVRHTSSDWSSYPEAAADRPWLVVYASTTDEVSAVLKLCHRRRIPVVAFGGGTSLEGHFANVCGGICLDLSRMDRILTVHAADFDAVVQPGVGYEQLNEELADRQLFFPPDPGPGATIGGMIGTGCSGTNSFCYGTMREWVLGLTVVLADGTVVHTRRRPRKSSAGYDLTRLFIGSEGTLGIVTEATVRLTSKPRYEKVAVATFDTFQDACDAVIRIVSAGVHVAAVELVGARAMRWINESAGRGGRAWPEAPTLFFKLAGTEQGVAEQMRVVEDVAKAAGVRSMETARDQDESAVLWEARKQALYTAAGGKAADETAWITDVAVPISRLADIVDATSKDMVASGVSGGIVGHVGDGNFHCFLFYNPKQKDAAEELVHRMIERAIAMDGTVTGEHGVGLVKRDYLNQELGTPAVDLMRQIKNAFDPLCLLNCDKVVRMKPSLKGSER
ncbi:FAD-binding, type 2 [Niveomyces insectorum RCEF 264]|uniref:D-lactate dehydrogenase (cytochrome) n=1 Tax=Niveomyces insectorum RCEF 264 TaxID=1081102 RepID=A0A167UU81_9HYPO|nr:FAD-binding, type 2 [Niveomyces insectorum RCEF 264]